MKRIAIFCDGTWNRLDAPYPTNVVIGSVAVTPTSADGKYQQVTYYNEGLGTAYTVNEGLEEGLAGAFGLGLFNKIADAYRFLIFNYVPGDEIYILGFSRGAFTARSLAGLIRKCGILRKDQVAEVGSAFSLYKNRKVGPTDAEAVTFRERFSYQAAMRDAERLKRELDGLGEAAGPPPFSIKYVGVWDTVGALGIPRYLRISDLIGTAERYRFYDTSLSSIVEYARHAVAIDEDRKAFEPTLWDNLDDLNRLPGRAGHYAQLWFPGDHGSVGGGGDIIGLSSAALIWILEGAHQAGLDFDWRVLHKAKDARNFLAPLHNVSQPPGALRSALDQVLFPRAPRKGPTTRKLLSDSARSRLDYTGPKIPPYRPAALPQIDKRLPQ